MGGYGQGRAASVESGVISRFLPEVAIVSIRSLGEGNINDTSLCVLNGHPSVVLQRINREVFSDPEGVAVNGWLVTEYLCRNQVHRENEGRRVSFIPTPDGNRYYLDSAGDVWRIQYFLENTVTCDRVPTVSAAYEGGKLLGKFHTDLKDFPGEQLNVPIPGFHDLPGYCVSYSAAERNFSGEQSADLAFCIQEVEKRLHKATIPGDAERSGAIRKRLIHGDPKSANMLLDSGSGRGVAMIDLDTVTWGLLMNDLGDCLRSFCNPVGETPDGSADVVFDINRCEAVLRGYADSGAYLPREEREFVYQGVRIMTYELAVRFLTDFLEGDRYFKVRDRFENLQRARTQIKLLQSIEKQKRLIEELVLRLFV